MDFYRKKTSTSSPLMFSSCKSPPPPPTSYFASNLSGRYNIWCMAYARDEWPFLIRFEIGTLKLNCAKTFRIRTNKVRLFPYFDCASPFLSLATHEKETCLFSSNGTRDKMAIYSPNTGMTGPYWEGFRAVYGAIVWSWK